MSRAIRTRCWSFVVGCLMLWAMPPRAEAQAFGFGFNNGLNQGGFGGFGNGGGFSFGYSGMGNGGFMNSGGFGGFPQPVIVTPFSGFAPTTFNNLGGLSAAIDQQVVNRSNAGVMPLRRRRR